MPSEPMRPLPSATELDRLTAAYRDNPRSTAFLPLAEAYLALGRPRDAIDTLNRGLASHPDHTGARLALGKAHVLLHQWKEAQVELLKVVKVDRQSREGFRLLGEVLMRRQDFERALPVLQHATNLDPADPKVLAMLRRARDGRPLDPPPPQPTPIEPSLGSGSPPPSKRPSRGFDAEPTAIADDQFADLLAAEGVGVDPSGEQATSIVDPMAPRRPNRPTGAPPPAAPPRTPPRSTAPPPAPPMSRGSDEVLGKMPLEKQRAAAVAEEKVVRRNVDERANEPAPEKKRGHVPPAEDPFRPLTERRPQKMSVAEMDDLGVAEVEDRRSPPPRKGAGATSPPPQMAEPPRPPREKPAERPRGTVAAPNKQTDLGAADKRRGAGVGEDYLNQLLVGGLLSVPNVEAREHGTDPEIARRWRSKIRNAFITLFVLLVLGAGGAGGYIYITNKKRDEAVARHLDAARTLFVTASQADLAKAEAELRKAYARDNANNLVAATLAEARALNFLLYGAGKVTDVDGVVSAAGQRLRTAKEDAPGRREYVIALAARNLAILDKAAEPAQAVAETRAVLDSALALTPGDGWLLFLDGQLRQMLGDRQGARASYEKADTGGKGPPIARVAVGDLLLDDGDAEGALAAYEIALQRAPNHPLALVGRALARVERSVDAEAAMQDLNVGLSDAVGTRTEAWKRLALASVWAYLEDYEKSAKELDAAVATGLAEPRFQARVGLLRLDRGKVVDAGNLRQKIRYYGDAPGRDPLLMLLDAEIFLASGMPEDALASVGDNPTLRGHIVKGRALLDLGRAADALKEFEAALKIAPEDARAKAYKALAEAIVSKGEKGFDALARLARGSVSGLVRYVLAEADLALGKPDDARRDLEASLEGDNPLAYRARTRLAEIYLAQGRVDEAEKALREALAQAPVYVPAHAVLGRILLQQGKTAEAIKELEAPVSAGRATAADELAYASALVAMNKKEEAKAPLKRARDKGAPAEQVGAVAAQIGPAFADELGVKAPEGPSAPKRPGRPGRRGR